MLLHVSGDPSTEYLSEGIPQSLINSLSQLSKPKVRSWSSTSRYKGHEVDAQKAGSELKVQAVLTGSMVLRGEDLSIRAELVDTLLWCFLLVATAHAWLLWLSLAVVCVFR